MLKTSTCKHTDTIQAQMKDGGWLADLRGPGAAALDRLFKFCRNRLILVRQRESHPIYVTLHMSWSLELHWFKGEFRDTVIQCQTEYHPSRVQSDLKNSIQNPSSEVHEPRYNEALICMLLAQEHKQALATLQ